MNVLVLRLAAPMQSWGTQSRFSVRDTAREPSKSGVVGLLCAALGRPRNADIRDLMALRMSVRIDRDGTLQRDYHTAGGGKSPDGSDYGVAKANRAKAKPVVSNRYYLADADFRVALEGDDLSWLNDLAAALEHPRWPLYLGRKSFVPAQPLCRGIHKQTTAAEALSNLEPWFARGAHEQHASEDGLKLRALCEVTAGDVQKSNAEFEVRQDVIDRFDSRDFQLRYVRTQWLTLSPELIAEDPSCFCHR
mgnify:CR=1 FL=1|tara:strand:- start:58580 stop:59326 length:747 start_codon:yes stop_codon:yes gene_type:complete